jgi:hypothetical protein
MKQVDQTHVPFCPGHYNTGPHKFACRDAGDTLVISRQTFSLANNDTVENDKITQLCEVLLLFYSIVHST